MKHANVFSAGLVSVLIWQALGLPLSAQEAPKLRIVVVEGEGAINNIRQRTARETIVQVEDENRKPVAGAVVTFVLPQTGASGTFPNGSTILTVLTDEKGRAVMRGLRPNSLSGNMNVNINASYQGQTASTTVTQTNAIAGAAGSGASTGVSTGLSIALKVVAALVVVGAAAVGTAVVANNQSNEQHAPPPATIITPGSPQIQ